MANLTKAELEKMICEVMEIKTITPQLRKQVSKYVLEDNMTYLEIARCIVYYQEIAHGVLNPVYGLWFIPSVKERAAKHFKELEDAKRQQEAEAQKVVEYQDNNIIFNIKALTHQRRKPKHFDLSEINVEGDENNGDN